jgi:hypothetical protein
MTPEEIARAFGLIIIRWEVRWGRDGLWAVYGLKA